MKSLRAPLIGALFFAAALLSGQSLVPDQRFATLPLLSGAGDIDLSLDLFLPAGEGPFPVLVLIHGGSYVTGDKADAAPLARDFVEGGVAVAAIDTRLGFVEDAGTETEAEAAGLADVTAAFRWIADHAALGLDTNRVYVGGWSSGGHLSLAVGVLYPLAAERPVQLRGVLDFYGGYFTEKITPAATPTLILQGTLDQACHPEASRSMARLLQSAGVWCRLLLAEGMYHSWEGRWRSTLVRWGTEFIGWSAPGASWPEAGSERYSERP